MSIVIDDSKEIVQLIESTNNVLIWNFHSGALLRKLDVYNDWTYSICMWNSHYIFIGCMDAKIILVDVNKGKIVKRLEGHKEKVLTIKKFKHFKYGEFLISQDAGDNDIKLWLIQKKK